MDMFLFRNLLLVLKNPLYKFLPDIVSVAKMKMIEAHFINGFVLKKKVTLEKKHVVLDSVETNYNI